MPPLASHASMLNLKDFVCLFTTPKLNQGLWGVFFLQAGKVDLFWGFVRWSVIFCPWISYSPNFGPWLHTGCLTTGVTSNHTLNFWLGGWILICFDIVIAKILRFIMVHNTWGLCWDNIKILATFHTEFMAFLLNWQSKPKIFKHNSEFHSLFSKEVFAKSPSVIHQNKPKTLGYHHIKAYYDPST